MRLCARLIKGCLDTFGQESREVMGVFVETGMKVLQECVCALT